MNNIQYSNKKEKAIIYLIASAVGMIIVFLSMIVAALFMVLFEIKLYFLQIVAPICLVLGSFASGYLSAKKIGYGGIISGLIVGVITYLFVFLISAVVDPTGITFTSFIHLIITLIASLIGGIVGVNKNYKFF